MSWFSDRCVGFRACFAVFRVALIPNASPTLIDLLMTQELTISSWIMRFLGVCHDDEMLHQFTSGPLIHTLKLWPGSIRSIFEGNRQGLGMRCKECPTIL